MTEVDTKPLLLTATDVAKLLQVTEGTVESEYRRGRLPGVLCGKNLRFRVADVEAYVIGLRPGEASK